MRLPRLNSLCAVRWHDITGWINEPMRKAKPQPCKTVGWLVRAEKNYLVVATSVYEGEGDDPTIDGCAIPLGCIESVKKLKE